MAIVSNYWKTFVEKRVSESNDDDTVSDKDKGETENDDELSKNDANEDTYSNYSALTSKKNNREQRCYIGKCK